MTGAASAAGARIPVCAVVLTREPCPDLSACVDSLGWVREVIAVDDRSTEGTRGMLRERGVRVLDQDRALVDAHEGNFDVARNAAFGCATQPWILVVDADEIVTPSLREEISATVARDERAAYEIPRQNLYWGRPSRVLGNDYQLRLFRRGRGRYRGTALDRPPEVDDPVRRLNAALEHRQRGLLRKLGERTDQRGRRLARSGEIPRAGTASLFWHHLRWYAVGQGAWREGPRGLALAAIYAAYPALEASKARRFARTGVSR